MTSFTKILLFCCLICASVSISYADAPYNLNCAKAAITKYYESGEYDREIKTIAEDAEKYLKKAVAENKKLKNPEKLAMVLDIDDTSISNYPNIKKRDFSNLPEQIEEAYQNANSPAIEPILKLYQSAIAEGVRVYFISFRPENRLNDTMKNLKYSGYTTWSHVYLATNKEIEKPAEIFKTDRRKRITKEGYRIILNLGDQKSDLVGGYAKKTFKLPNPLYTSPVYCNTKMCQY